MERSFAQVVRDRRLQLDLQQEELARRIKTSTPYIGHLESGKRHPSDKIVTRLAEVLGLDRRELFFLANPRAQALLKPERGGDSKSAWEDFRKNEQIRRIHNITTDEIEMLERAPLLGRHSDPSTTCDICGASLLPDRELIITVALIHLECSGNHQYHRRWVNAGGDSKRPEPARWETVPCNCT
jgi:transcriptional regulator with XRE-family HTH domain